MKKTRMRNSRSEKALIKAGGILLLSALLILGVCMGGKFLYDRYQVQKAERIRAEEARMEQEREKREREEYPVRYLELVTAASEKYDLTTLLLLSVIRTESSFRPEAVSRAGAVGLMQIMPDTFSWLCEKRGESHGTEELTDPAVSIDYGAYYLRVLLDYFDGSLDNALLAYNAGIGRVSGWLQEKELPRNGVLEEIPISETASYLIKVHHAMDEYTRIYKGDFTNDGRSESPQ